MKHLYSLRSRAAHGGTGDIADEDAKEARWALGKAIKAIVNLANTGELEVPEGKKTLAHSIESLVLKRAVRPFR